MRTMKSLFAKDHVLVSIIFLIVLTICVWLLLENGKAENIPSVFFSWLAALFSFYAYLFTREKFRLDLLEKRWVVYEEVLKFCSAVIKHGGLPHHSDSPDREDRNREIIEALIAAEKSFRGIGYHKTKSMFGEDIDFVFSKLNESYSFFTAHNIASRAERAEMAHEWSKHARFVWKTVNELPDLFRPYVYFEDYKSER